MAHFDDKISAIKLLENRLQPLGVFGASGMDLHAPRSTPALDVKGCSRPLNLDSHPMALLGLEEL